MNKGRLIVFSAPSGCGKGTMLEQIMKDEHYSFSVSATTRAPREGEVDGVNYYYLSKEEFQDKSCAVSFYQKKAVTEKAAGRTPESVRK